MELGQRHGRRISPDGKFLVTGGVKSSSKFSIIVAFPVPTGKDYSSRLQLWDLSARREIALLEDWQKGMICALEFSPDGKSLASSHFYSDQEFHLIGIIPVPLKNSSESYLKIWDVAQRSQRARLGNPHGMSGALAYAPDGSTLAAGSRYDRRVQVWDAAASRPVDFIETAPVRTDNFRQGVPALAYAPDGSTLALACNAWDPDAKEKKLVCGLSARGQGKLAERGRQELAQNPLGVREHPAGFRRHQAGRRGQGAAGTGEREVEEGEVIQRPRNAFEEARNY